MNHTETQVEPAPPAEAQRDDAQRRFACPCCGQKGIDPRIPAIVRCLEERAQERLTVTSGFRCPRHNEKVAGSPTSSHLRGLAVDIACKSDALRFAVIERALELQVTRIGIAKTYIHLDIDRRKNGRRVWVY